MTLSNHDWKHCFKQLRKLCPGEYKEDPMKVYDYLKDDKNLTEDQKHMLNRLWLDYVHKRTG